MAIGSLEGQWRSIAAASTNSQVKIDAQGEPDPHGISEWLNGFDFTLARTARTTSGLTLTINSASATFTERATGNPEIEWFDAEGVLTEGVVPFDGIVICNSQGGYLRPHSIFELGTPVEGRYGDAILRYDDGDTKIADNLRLDGELLVRTVNVVTDELYLNRVIIVYEWRPE